MRKKKVDAREIKVNELRQILKLFLRLEFERLPETVNELPPEKRLEFLAKLLPFILPKVDSVSCSAWESYSFDAEAWNTENLPSWDNIENRNVEANK